MEIPDGWKRLPLGDLFEFKNGYNTDKSAYGSGTPFVNVMEVFNTDKLVVEDIVGKVTASQEHLELFSVVYGDVLFNRTSETPEDIAMATTYMADDKAIFGGFVIRGRQITKSLLAEYCVYCFQSSSIRKAMISRGQGAIRSNIGQKDLNKVALLFPPLKEQRRIAEILGTWDRAIAATEALIAKSEAQKKALMQQLLTAKRRLAGFEGEWKEVRLGDVFDVLTAPSKTKKIDDTGTKLIVDMGAIDRSSQLVAHKKIVTRTHPLNEGDLVMPKDDIGGGQIIGRVAYIPDSSSYELGDHVYGLRHKSDEAVPLFSYYRINEFEVLKSLRRKANGTAQLGLGKKDVLKQVVSFPSQSEQRAISFVLKGTDGSIQAIQAKLQTLKTEKAALMQQLLTGKRRVKLTEAAA